MLPKKKRKFALKSFAIVSALGLFIVAISLATGILKIDIVASSVVKEIPANYEKLEGKIADKIESGKNFIFFTSSWCGPCQTMSNLYKLSAQKYSDIKFIETDIEVNRELANSMSTSYAPVVLFVQDGKVIGNSEVNINEIEKIVDKYASL